MIGGEAGCLQVHRRAGRSRPWVFTLPIKCSGRHSLSVDGTPALRDGVTRNMIRCALCCTHAVDEQSIRHLLKTPRRAELQQSAVPVRTISA
jgi:hypothetical protein